MTGAADDSDTAHSEPAHADESAAEVDDDAGQAPSAYELAQAATDELLMAVARWRRRYPDVSIEAMQETVRAVFNADVYPNTLVTGGKLSVFAISMRNTHEFGVITEDGVGLLLPPRPW